MKYLSRLAPICFLAITSSAQQPITLPIAVEGASQSSLPLQISDLKVEANHESVPVLSLTSLSGKHLQYVLINEATVYVGGPGGTGEQEQVAKELVKQVISPGSDIGTLVNYGDEAFLDVQNESDPKKLSSRISSSTASPTRLFDAVVESAGWLAKQPPSPDGRKVIFLVCDGRDTGSHASLADAVGALQKASLPIFVFAPSYFEKKKQGHSLRELAESSGGRVYFLPAGANQRTFDGLKRDLADSFLLTLKLTTQKGPLPLSIAKTGLPQISILYQAQVFVP